MAVLTAILSTDPVALAGYGRVVDSMTRRLLPPGNDSEKQIQVSEERGLLVAVLGRREHVVIRDFNILAGVTLTAGEQAPWWRLDGPVPDGSFALFRADDFAIEAVTDAFVLEENGLDDQGNMILLKSNGGGSTVQGFTVEGRLNYNDYVEFSAGMTFQNSKYDESVQWSSELEGTTNYLRTPDDYGYYTLDISPNDRIGISFSGVYTGNMLVPHFGGAPGVPNDEVIQSRKFFDQNIKLSYLIPIKSIRQGLQFFGGVKNVFNSYQDDFDVGRYRDSNYVYGSARPRTIFFGIKLESL